MQTLWISVISFLLGFSSGTYLGYHLKPKQVVNNIKQEQKTAVNNYNQQIQKMETYIDKEKHVIFVRTNYITNYITVTNISTNFSITNKQGGIKWLK